MIFITIDINVISEISGKFVKLYCFIYYTFVFYYVFSEHVFIFRILFTCSSLYHQDSFAVCIAIVTHRDLESFQTSLSYGIAPFETHRSQISCS